MDLNLKERVYIINEIQFILWTNLKQNFENEVGYDKMWNFLEGRGGYIVAPLHIIHDIITIILNKVFLNTINLYFKKKRRV